MPSTIASEALPVGVRDTGPRRRIPSLDIIRGGVMLLMAVDHVRVYFSSAQFEPTDLSQATAALFLTRWVTHFCAPAFVFLAGTGAFLGARKLGSGRELTRLLLIRGAWLILIELTLMRLAWTFNLHYEQFAMGGILWVIGLSMIALAGLSRLPLIAVTGIGAIIVFGHNVMNYILPSLAPTLGESPFLWLWRLLYLGGGIRLGEAGPLFFVLYSFVPWVGVMALGYAFGAVMQMAPERRRRLSLALGASAIGAFLVLRGFNLYGNPTPWEAQESVTRSVLSFVNTWKYPASLLFLLMTLGPTLVLSPLLEKARGRMADLLALFGRVPFFFYVLHIPLIHMMAVVWAAWTDHGEALSWLFLDHPVMIPRPPAGWGFGPLGIWVAAAIASAMLYPACRWFAAVKARRSGLLMRLL